MKRDWQRIAERITAEGPLAVSAAAKLVKAERGQRGHCSASSLVRWIVAGKQGVFLDGVRMAGETWFTSKAALVRFSAQLSEVSAGNVPAPQASDSDIARREQV